MSKRLEGQVALITGSTRGLGKAAALALAAEGAAVVITGRQQTDCEAVAATIVANGGRALAIAADVSDLGQVRHLVESAIAWSGRLDILVNNAGGNTYAAWFWEYSEADLLYLVNSNYNQVFVASQVAARQMIKQRSGRIINVSTGGAAQAHVTAAIYDSIKAGVESLTRCMAAELGQYGISVNCIAPGTFMTKPENFADTPANRARLKTIPLGRFGTAEDFAHLVVFLCAKESEYITGQTITIDGGRSTHLPQVIEVPV